MIALEIYGDRAMDGTEALERFVADHGNPSMRIWGEKDYSAPYASGSSRTDAVVICPCSMASIGTIVAGAEANLIHRAAGVQLKERRKLVLVPRETPLSSIHLENLLRIRNAGADVVPAMPGFYHLPQTIDDLIDFVAGRVIDSLGLDMTLSRAMGWSQVSVQPERVREMFDRISPSYDRMNRVMSLGMDGRWREARRAGRAAWRRAIRRSTCAAAPATWPSSCAAR